MQVNFTLLTQYLVLTAVSVKWQACLNVKNTIIFDSVTILFLELTRQSHLLTS